MTTLIFDTETTGLPKKKYINALEEKGNWPEIVSICWHVYEGRELMKKVHYIIRPQGWSIPEESVKFHGITQERADTDGRPLLEVLKEFRVDIENAMRIVTHNLAFDKNIIFNAYYWHLDMNPRAFWPEGADFCTMENTKWELKLPSKYPRSNDPYKNPSLDELYVATFNEPAPENAHSADRDTEVLQKIYWKRWA